MIYKRERAAFAARSVLNKISSIATIAPTAKAVENIKPLFLSKPHFDGERSEQHSGCAGSNQKLLTDDTVNIVTKFKPLLCRGFFFGRFRPKSFARFWLVDKSIKGYKSACYYNSDPYAFAAWKINEKGKRVQDYNPPLNPNRRIIQDYNPHPFENIDE